MRLKVDGRWLALTLLVLVAFVGAIMMAGRFVRLPEKPKPAGRDPKVIGFRQLDASQSGATLSDQMLLDPVPLFVPTRWNASQPDIPELTRREPGAAFQPFAAKYIYKEDAAGIVFPESAPLPDAPVAALSFGRRPNLFEVWGNFYREEESLPARVALLEVVQRQSGRVIFSAPLNPPSPPAAIGKADWLPIELLATIDDSGLIGTLMLTQGSGVDAVDSFLRGYLSKQFHLGERVPAGFYTLRVGP